MDDPIDSGERSDVDGGCNRIPTRMYIDGDMV